MSRFETSKFVRDKSVMNQECLIQACEKLNWKYKMIGDELHITDIGIKHAFYGEYAIMLKGNKVTYNSYYLGNSNHYVDRLKNIYSELHIEYSKNLILTQFKNKGFTYKSNEKFIPNETEKISFFMVGRSKNKNEIEPIGQIKFTILDDGTIISDSNYLPDDINKLAHEAMDGIDMNFNTKRIMTKKDIPLKYQNRLSKASAIKVRNLKTK